MVVQKIDPRSTKAEVMEAFNALAKEHATLQNEANALRKQQKAAEAARPPVEAAPTTGDEPVAGARGAVPREAATVESVVADLLGLRAAFGGALNALSDA